MSQRVVQFGSMDLTVDGDKLEIGNTAPNFIGKSIDLSDYEFNNEEDGKIKIISAVPSLDTSVCELQTYLLFKSASDFPEDVKVISVSNDLPFAQKRFSDDKEVNNIKFVSDYLYKEFANAYHVLINELDLINRSIFVVDKDNVIRYAEYLKQNTELPNIDRAIEVALSLSNQK